MKSLSRPLLLGSLAVATLAACSAGDGKGKDDSDGSGAKSGSGDGDGDGDSPGDGDGDVVLPVGDGDGDDVLPPDDTIPDDTIYECEDVSDCVEQIMGAVADDYLCTADGECGEKRGPCTEQSECQADTYCCEGSECLGTPGDGGFCIPSSVGPGAPCSEAVELGVFAPSVQCEWLGPGPAEPSPNSDNVSVTPLVADLPLASGEINQANPEGTSSEVVIITWDPDAPNSDGSNFAPGVIRILDGQNCQLLESIVDTTHSPRAIATPALADLNNDGTIEIVARRDAGGLVAYTWNGSAYELYWHQSQGGVGVGSSLGQAWDGPAIHDLNDDGLPEVILRNAVYNGQTGAVIHAGGTGLTPAGPYAWYYGLLPVVADLNEDGTVDLLADRQGFWDIHTWSYNPSGWVKGIQMTGSGNHFGYADFGTPGATPEDFNPTALDGTPEIVAVSETGGVVTINTLTGQEILSVTTSDRGGPPNIGDFDGDGFPEVGVAGGFHFRVFDLDCLGAGCNGNPVGVRWIKSSEDDSSQNTGGTIFDFDGDGKAEVVYADECFLRVYKGDDGTVLYSSYRNSGTWYENALVADIDRDQNTEIVVNSNDYSDSICAAQLDAIHPGIGCDTDAECPATSTCSDGYCRCASDADCRGSENLQQSGLTCAAPVLPASGGNVCRAAHPGSAASSATGIRVLRDSLDRWASSRSIWNQHTYSITNVNDDGSIPRTSEWKHNWKEPGMNNYRQNIQGTAGFTDLPDIQGRFSDDEPCVTGTSSSKLYLQATVCNRGKRAVGSELPATFYKGDPSDNEVLCTSYTDGPVPTGGCKLVYCEIGSDAAGQEVTIVVNDDGNGGRSTVECRTDNNSDSITVGSCSVPVVR